MKVYLDAIGCRLNQAEIESMAGQFRAAGHEVVACAEEAELAVVNTCAVTAAGVSDSKAKIRRIARAGARQIVATGCWSTLEPEAASSLPGVQRVVPNAGKDQLVSEILGAANQDFALRPIIRLPVAGPRRRTRAFIKVQDGCDNRCTFCVTTVARGRGRSRRTEAVLRDVQSALAGGAREVVLTGVHLGSWGHDFGTKLDVLVRAVLRETDVPRLRLSSLEPWDLDEEFFGLWESPRLCRHLHLPLQSGCPSTLKRMARKTTPKDFRRLVQVARRLMPDVAITTDIIAGFPGETDDEFRESLDFVQSMAFAGGHAFRYSARPGTVAARRTDQVPHAERAQRTHAYLAAFEHAAGEYRTRFIGTERFVLWESARQPNGSWELAGLTDNYIRVRAVSHETRWNQLDRVRLVRTEGAGLFGIITK
jgi:threonylcarbamoyladenosine tRNA methylthiotransferase MtaB